MLAAGDDKGEAQVIDVPTKQPMGSFQLPNDKSVGTLFFNSRECRLEIIGTVNF